jgi:Tfp pilus assembly protein PilF
MMKKTFVSGLVLGALVTLPIAAGSVYWIMKELQQTRAQMLLIEAHAHMKKSEPNRAIAKLNQSVGADPYRDLAHLALAELYEQTGDVELALKEYELTKALCDNCYIVDEKLIQLRAKSQDQAPKQKP